MSAIEEIEKRWKLDGHLDDWDVNWFIQKVKFDAVYIHQLRGALGYPVQGDIRENPEIHNGIAEALQKQVESLEDQLRSGKTCCHPLCLTEKVQLTERVKELQFELQRAKSIEMWEDPAYVKFLEDRVKDLEEGIRSVVKPYFNYPELGVHEGMFKLRKLIEEGR